MVFSAAAALLLARPCLAGPVSTATVAVSGAPLRLEVVWPKEGDKFPFLSRSFTFGNATPGATVKANGRTLQVDADGVFFDMVAFSSGAFVLDYEAALDGVVVSTRRVVDVGPPGGLPETGPREVLALEPSVDKELRPGDVLPVRCKGPPGLPAAFSIQGIARNLPLVESSAPVRGLYDGYYAVQPGDRGKNLAVACSLRAGFWSSLQAAAPGRVSIAEPGRFRVAETTAKLTVLKTPPGGYSMFFPPGIRLEVTGRSGDLLRASLGDELQGWLEAASVKLLPDGTPPPRAVVGRDASTSVEPDAVRLAVDVSAPAPFEVRQTIDPLSFEIRFYGASQRFDRIRYAPDDPVVRDVRWRQENARTVLVTVDTRLRWGWGYDAAYDGGRFLLDIRRPPDLTRSRNVLSGRRIVLDPGHGPDTGAVGPRGTTERELNLAIADALAGFLREDDAQVYMIRSSTEGPPLAERPSEAWKARGELYVSVHNNALPASADPWERPRGYMLFYYHPQSLPLAEAMHRAYRRRLPDEADEALQWGDLLVCRVTQMPAILTESDYVIFPDREKRLLDPVYEKKLAHTLYDGIKSFYEDYRGLQLQTADERRAARRP